jgi:heptosyltransferase I
MHSSSKHELENYRNLFSFSAVPYSAIPKLMSSLVINNKYIVFHICPSGEKSYLKEWPVKNWVELGLYLNNLGFEIVMTGSKDDFYSNQKVSQKLTSSVNLAGETNFEELVPYLNCAEMVVSVNTGVLHIAAATDTKVISINGPTSVKRWGALGENSMNLVSDLSCSPCLNLGFEYGCNENNCMKSISVENVKEAIHKLLG